MDYPVYTLLGPGLLVMIVGLGFLGIVLLLLGAIGGSITIGTIEIPTLGRRPRAIAIVVGVLMSILLLGLVQSDRMVGISASPGIRWFDAPGEETPGLVLFGVVLLGILANAVWAAGWEYVRNPSQPLSIGPLKVVFVRVVLSAIAAALTFGTTYTKVAESAAGPVTGYFLAFQSGFFWQSALDAVVKQSGVSRRTRRPRNPTSPRPTSDQ